MKQPRPTVLAVRRFGASLLVLVPLLASSSAVTARPGSSPSSSPRAPEEAATETAKRPPPVSVSVRLIAKRATYVLPDGGKRLRQQIDEVLRMQAAEKAAAEGQPIDKQLERRLQEGYSIPDAPAVDLALEITNTSALPIDLVLAGDLFGLGFELRGTGAVTLDTRALNTAELRWARPVRLQPGHMRRIVIDRLTYGRRGDATRAYFTCPGKYSLTASLDTMAKAAASKPSSAEMFDPTFVTMKLTSNTVTLVVIGKDVAAPASAR